MFTWICPKCGGEVPPSYDDCPRCAPPAVKAADAEAPAAEAPAPPAAAPPPAPRPVERTQPVSAVPPPAPPASPPVIREKHGPSGAVVGLLAAFGVVALLAVLYLYVLPQRTSGAKATAQTHLQTPGAAGSARSAHPLAKHLEVTGVRLRDVKNGKATVQFVVVNHSGANLPDLTVDVTLRSADKVFFEVPAKVPSLGPFEVKDLSASVATELKSYELPDWQMIRPEFSVRTE